MVRSESRLGKGRRHRVATFVDRSGSGNERLNALRALLDLGCFHERVPDLRDLPRHREVLFDVTRETLGRFGFRNERRQRDWSGRRCFGLEGRGRRLLGVRGECERARAGKRKRSAFAALE